MPLILIIVLELIGKTNDTIFSYYSNPHFNWMGLSRKKLSLGIVPIIIASAVISAILCVIINVCNYQINGPSKSWSDTLYCESYKDSFIMSEKDILGWDVDLDELNGVVIDKSKEKPVLRVIKLRERRDMNLFWQIGPNTTIQQCIVLNPKHYAVYKAFKDSLEQRKDSLSKTD